MRLRKGGGVHGLELEYVKEAKLRISATRFRKELLRGDERTLGRYDARFKGWDPDAAGENPGYDPSDTGISGVYVGAFHEYIQRELKYMSRSRTICRGRGSIRTGTSTTGLRGRSPAAAAVDVAASRLRRTWCSTSRMRCGRIRICGCFQRTDSLIWRRRSLRPSMTWATWSCRRGWWECAVRVLSGGTHGVSERGSAEGDEGGYGEVLCYGRAALRRRRRCATAAGAIFDFGCRLVFPV